MPRDASAKRKVPLKERFAPPAEKPKLKKGPIQFKLPCDDVYQVGITTTRMDVSSGDAVLSGCTGKFEPVGMALTDAKAGEPVMLMVGFIPKSDPANRGGG